MAVQWTRRNVKTRAAKRRKLECEPSIPTSTEKDTPGSSSAHEKGGDLGATVGRREQSKPNGAEHNAIESSTLSSGTDENTPGSSSIHGKGSDLGSTTVVDSEHCGNEPGSEPNESATEHNAGEHRLVVPDNRKVRSSMVDYQRDVCTQYMKTGRCRYGDACKFAHERGTKTRTPKPAAAPTPERVGCCECSSTDNMVDPPCNHRYCERCFLKLSKANDPCRVCSRPLKTATPLS